jgi:hypothetical protein
MKKSELRQLIREEIQKVLKENIGIYISDAYLGIIIKSLQKSKYVYPHIIEDLINKKDVARNILLNKKAIYKSLQINGKTLGLNEETFNMLLNKISDLISGKATFVDYILNEGFQGDEPEGDGLSGFRGDLSNEKQIKYIGKRVDHPIVTRAAETASKNSKFSPNQQYIFEKGFLEGVKWLENLK